MSQPRAVNCYAIESENGLTLIDCGVHDTERLDELVAALEQVSGGSFTFDRIICTHLHPDHMGGAADLVDRFDAEFVMHETTSSLLEEYNDWNINRTRVATLARMHGAPSDELRQLEATWERPDWAGSGIAPTRPVADGDKVDIGGDRFLEVIHTPGHHPTHICLQDSATGRLFSGDHILPRITPFVPYDASRDTLAEYLEGLERLERIDPGTTLPAHGPTVEQGRERARQIALHHERRLGAMSQATKSGAGTAWHVMTEVFRPDLSPADKYLAFQETLAHMEHLVARRRMRRKLIDGVWVYAR